MASGIKTAIFALVLTAFPLGASAQSVKAEPNLNGGGGEPLKTLLL